MHHKFVGVTKSTSCEQGEICHGDKFVRSVSNGFSKFVTVANLSEAYRIAFCAAGELQLTQHPSLLQGSQSGILARHPKLLHPDFGRLDKSSG
jgi:hypothetical protein